MAIPICCMAMPLLQRNEWRAAQLRLTVFPAIPTDAPDPAWWKEATGQEPDEVNISLKKTTALVTGPFANGKLVLEIQAGRIDWRLQAEEAEIATLIAEPHIPDIAAFDEALRPFVDVCRTWMARDRLPEIVRVAFGAVLLHPEESREAGYARLPDYVPVRVDPKSSDFMYQINRPVDSIAVRGVAINRLSKWSVAKLNLAQVTQVGNDVILRAHDTLAVNAFRLELDINTIPAAQQTLPKDRLTALYDELVTLGTDIVERGDQLP